MLPTFQNIKAIRRHVTFSTLFGIGDTQQLQRVKLVVEKGLEKSAKSLHLGRIR